MHATTKPTEFHDAVHAVALSRMRKKGSRHYRWWLLAQAISVAAVIAARLLLY